MLNLCYNTNKNNLIIDITPIKISKYFIANLNLIWTVNCYSYVMTFRYKKQVKWCKFSWLAFKKCAHFFRTKGFRPIPFLSKMKCLWVHHTYKTAFCPVYSLSQATAIRQLPNHLKNHYSHQSTNKSSQNITGAGEEHHYIIFFAPKSPVTPFLLHPFFLRPPGVGIVLQVSVVPPSSFFSSASQRWGCLRLLLQELDTLVQFLWMSCWAQHILPSEHLRQAKPYHL
jgi:hypothetical protein